MVASFWILSLASFMWFTAPQAKAVLGMTFR